MIKPSGSDQTVAIISDDHLLVQPKDMPAKVWQYRLGTNPEAKVVTNPQVEAELKQKLESFLQTATKSLLDNTAGVEDPK